MDPESFDQIVSRIAAAPSRREALKGMGLGVLAALGGTAAGMALDESADGKGRGKGRKKKNKGGGDKNKGNGKNNGGGDKNKGNGKNNGGGDKNKGNGGGGDKNKGNGGGGDENKGNGGGDVDAEKKGAGGRCRRGKNCLSNRCQGSKKKRKKNKGRCDKSDVGQRCETDSDCIDGSPCVGGICSFLS